MYGYVDLLKTTRTGGMCMNELVQLVSNSNEIPWWVGLILVILSSLGGAIATRLTAKDKAQATLVNQTVERQKQLDERQNQMMDDLSADIDRLRDELSLVQKDLLEERRHNRSLSAEMEEIKKENVKLREENNSLKLQIEDLKNELQKVSEESTRNSRRSHAKGMKDEPKEGE